jgi:hypothetical protein
MQGLRSVLRWDELLGRHSADVPTPPTRDVQFKCGDIVEEGCKGFDVLLLVSAAFTDHLLAQIARVLNDCPVGTLVSVRHAHRSCAHLPMPPSHEHRHVRHILRVVYS